jgi:osmotically-inducible protein OsmY
MPNDQQLVQDVMAELDWDPSLTAAHIGVTAEQGIVTLSGHVESFAEKRAAEAAAYRVNGAHAVIEGIEVRLPFSRKKSDEQIAATAIDHLAWNVTVPPDAISVMVESGWVTLTGKVDGRHQKEAALRDICQLTGVIGIIDHISITPCVNIETVSDGIMHAFHRSWFFDTKRVTVSAQGGKIHLTGTVPTQHDRRIAAEIAWAAPGATDVENDIKVHP